MTAFKLTVMDKEIRLYDLTSLVSNDSMIATIVSRDLFTQNDYMY